MTTELGAMIALVGSCLGALMFIVKWFTRSMDRRDQALIDSVAALQNAVRAFDTFEEEERETHQAIKDELGKQTEVLTKVGESLERLENK